MKLRFSLSTSSIKVSAMIEITDLRYSDDPATLDLLFDSLRAEYLERIEILQSKASEQSLQLIFKGLH